jgi:hypothetical protein
MPEHDRISRREQRRAWRGTPAGRRATRKVETTYGRKQRERDRLAAWQAAIDADKAAGEGNGNG